MRRPSRALLLLALLLNAPNPAKSEEALLMGVFPRRNASITTQFFTPLAKYLQKQLGRPVKLVTAKDFRTFWLGVTQKRYDIVHYNQYHYLKSASEYEVIASNIERGSDKIAGAIYVRSDSGITEVSQLKGRNIIFGGGRDAMMSYIVPRYLLQKGGLAPTDYKTSFANNPPNAVLAVYYKQADAGGAGDVVMNLPTVTSIAKAGELRHLTVSDPIKHLPWTVKRELPRELRLKIKQLLINLTGNEHGKSILKAAHVNGFSAATDTDYNSARTILEQVPVVEKE